MWISIRNVAGSTARFLGPGIASRQTDSRSAVDAAVNRTSFSRSAFADGKASQVIRTGIYWMLVVATALIAAELATRLDDWIRLGVPPSQNSYSEDGLILHGPDGTRGRPHARYKKWKLNQFGFRGPEMLLRPISPRPRIMILGSSEAFGLYESEDKEFPRNWLLS